jgi:putative peptidoglycan lipid II flippase
LIAPGLATGTLTLASRMSVILWPTVIFSGAVSLLSSLYQAKGRFTWPAVVPTVGAVVNLGMIVVLVNMSLGVEALATAMLVSLTLQAVLLFPIAFGRLRIEIDWTNPGLRRVVTLVWPLIVSSLIARLTPVVDRYLASDMTAGTISQLGYAYRIVTLLATFLSSGIATVIFPGMATNVAQGDVGALRKSVSRGFRMMWLVIAPVITIGIALALPITIVVFQRGAFSVADAHSVSRLLQLYLLALVGMCLGNITGRTFYALKRTRLIAILGGVSALAYIGYAPALAHVWGALGVAAACVVLFNFDIAVNAIVIRAITGNKGGWKVIVSLARITIAAVVGGLAAWGVSIQFLNPLIQFLAGGSGGVAMYLLVLVSIRSPELATVGTEVSETMKSKFAGIRTILKREKS